MDKIDFVLIWVDDSDPVWQADFETYSEIEFGDARKIRYRDWGTLKYWFRGVEKFTPWVNNVYFVTCGHVPEWLNLENPKLKFVQHSDYIPKEWLPTFNSHTIELNLHRIKGLSENFVYFNDDTFIIDYLSKERFFKNGQPCDIAALNAYQPSGDMTDHIAINNVALINQQFCKASVIKTNFAKWFSPSYRGRLLRTAALMAYPKFTGFIDPHLPNAYKKDTFHKVWGLYEESLAKTSESKFRKMDNVNQYIFRYYQLVTGNFQPINPKNTSLSYSVVNDTVFALAVENIKTQKKPLICLNDGDISDFTAAKKSLCDAFETILPEKSGYEK